MNEMDYTELLRARITELRLKKNVSEHKMSLDLDKSGSYIRLITNGASLPSVRELFHIIAYLEVSPAEFFAPFQTAKTPQELLCSRIHQLDETKIDKVNTFISMIE